MTDPDDEIKQGSVEHELAERLIAQRPVPRARFRGRLGRQLAVMDPGYGARPEQLWPVVTICLAAGLLMLALGLLESLGML